MGLPPEFDYSSTWHDAHIFSHDLKSSQNGTHGIRTYSGFIGKIMCALGFALKLPIQEGNKVIGSIAVSKKDTREFFAPKCRALQDSTLTQLIQNYAEQQRGLFPSVPLKANEETVHPKDYSKRQEAAAYSKALAAVKAYQADKSDFAARVDRIFTLLEPDSAVASQDILQAFRECSGSLWTGHIMDYVTECLEESHQRVEEGEAPEKALEHFKQSLHEKITQEIAYLPIQAKEIADELKAIAKERTQLFRTLNLCLKSPLPSTTAPQQLIKDLLTMLNIADLAPFEDRTDIRNNLFQPEKLQEATKILAELHDTLSRKRYLNETNMLYGEPHKAAYDRDLQKIEVLLKSSIVDAALLQCLRASQV